MGRLVCLVLAAAILLAVFAGPGRSDSWPWPPEPPECSGLLPAFWTGLAVLERRRLEHAQLELDWTFARSPDAPARAALEKEAVLRATVAIEAVCSQQAWIVARMRPGGR